MFCPGWFIQHTQTGTVYQVLAVDLNGRPLCKLLISEQKWCVGEVVKLTHLHELRRVYADLSAVRQRTVYP